MLVKSTNRFDYQNAAVPLGVMPKNYPDGFDVGIHQHDRGQLIYAISGLMKVSTAAGQWLIPPQHALWMPPNIDHNMRAHGQVSMQTLYVRVDAIPETFSDGPQTIRVSSFLRELIRRASTIPVEYDELGHDARVLSLILGEIDWKKDAADLSLMLAKDKRLSHVCDAILANPGDNRYIEDWAQFASASSRTLARLFKEEFGVTFTCWRQQVRMLAAMPRLASGEAITSIALDLGYETPGAFTNVFRRFMGAPPSDYFRR
jgi:AraC-like DNA-binding protein